MWEIVYDRAIGGLSKDIEWYEFKIGPIYTEDERDNILRIMAGDPNVGNITIRKYEG